ncbi:MAG TPA: hypothetical protein VFL47_00560, partial [Flavisolibacter sp.]|nr:hypothetical protein [Flavisolibacter sp.]
DYANLWSYAATAQYGVLYGPTMEEEDAALEKSISNFEEQCRRNGIHYRVHRDFTDFAFPQLKQESRFADVMIMSGELFFKEFITTHRDDYLGTAIHQAESPVVIVPEKMPFPTTNVIAYDGSEESVYALKQFAYIFPGLAKNKTLLVYSAEGEESDFPSKDYVVELATQHYPDLTFYKLDLDPKKFFATWIAEQKGTILISGSFGRSALSQALKKSFVSEILSDHQIPVFIAHK